MTHCVQRFWRRPAIAAATMALFSTAGTASTAAHAGELQVTIHKLLPDQGTLLLALFATEQGFPDQPQPSQPQLKVPAKGEVVIATFRDVPPGRYAVMVVQDLNGNGRIDYNFVGMPREPYGASNNRLPALSPPKFEESLFQVTGDRSALTIELRRP